MTPGRPKFSLIGHTFAVSGVDGMMNPFALEVILNPEVLPFERPYVLAHEWAHLAGHAPESEASFVAFLACLQGPREMRYSGWLDILLHVLRALPPPTRQGASRRSRRALAPTCARSRPACAACSRRSPRQLVGVHQTCAPTALRAEWPITPRC